MSQTPTISQPPEPLTSTSSRIPPPPVGSEAAAILETAGRLRVELEATTDRARQARLWLEIAHLEERAGDEPGAARDYLAAYNADQTFREPLESLVRLLEKRRSLRNLGKLIEALTRAAASPEEKARAVLMRAAYQADVGGDWDQALASAREAAAVDGAPAAEQASAWLAVELAAAKVGDGAARAEALAERTRFATDPAWRALLLTDRGRLALAEGDAAKAIGLLEEACALESTATWAATILLERISAERAADAAIDDAKRLAETHADALDATAALLEKGVVDAGRADALGVPRWARTPARLVDAWLRAAEARRLLGQTERAGTVLDRALAYASALDGEEARIAEHALVDARIRIAEQVGDTALAARVAERRSPAGDGADPDGQRAAALAMRVAEHAAVEGDVARAFQALSRAVASDPSCLPARALQLDMLADGGDPAAFAAQLESFADHLATDEARGRAFLLTAFVWAAQAKDVAGAKAALSQAALCGVAASTVARLGRVLASVVDDGAWYEESTKRLLAAGAEDAELASLYVELVRLRHARGDAEGEARALREMAGAPAGGWLARALEAFLPREAGARGDGATASDGGRRRAAIEELASLEKDAELARGLSLVATLRAIAGGDEAAARARLAELTERDPSDVLVATMLGDLLRAAGDHGAAGRLASATAAAGSDPELAAALRFEAAFERWRAADRKGAIAELEAAESQAPAAARMVLGWAGRGAIDAQEHGQGERGAGGDASGGGRAPEPAIEARRKALERARAGGVAGAHVLALERFAAEVGQDGDADAAAAALATVEAAPGGDLGIAAALARLSWSHGSADRDAVQDAIARIAAHGPRAVRLATAERTRVAREGGDAGEIAAATRAWFEAGGGLPAALEWLAAATSARDHDDDVRARLAIAAVLDGDAQDALVASAALAGRLAEPGAAAPIVTGDTAAVRLANLELAPPGCDPRRRAKALSELDGALGEGAAEDARSLSGWSSFAAADLSRAREAFEAAARARPDDLAAWEGLRACAEVIGDGAARAEAAAEIGKRCRDAARAAAFWEEAGLLWIDLHDDARADAALEESFARDASRPVAFDKLFRRVRARKENDKLLALIARRLDTADDPAEIQKLFWEQARVLREKGEQDGALKALEHVTLLDPDHVGALALLGEINIRRGQFEEAARSLARLAMLDVAPARNRVTAGVAAVDLYENKLDRHDKALEVLLSLHRAKLSTLPVRERLARAAARTGAWNEATAMLEVLMNERADAQGRIEAARLAMSIHRDRLGSPKGAIPAVVKLLEEVPTDSEALELLFSTDAAWDVRGRLFESARRALVDRLQKEPTDPAAVRQLAKVARALSDGHLQQAALGTLVALGAADERSEQSVARLQLATKKSRPPQIAVGPEMLRSLLAPGDGGPIADLFALLGPTLAEALGPTLQSLGVGRRDRVDPRSGLSLRNEIAAWAGAFGIQELELYVGGSDPLGAQGVPGDPPALVVGSGVNAPMSPLARARVARELVAIARGTTVVRLRDDVTVAAIVAAACRLAEVPIQHPPYAVLAEVERQIGKAIARRTRKLLPEPCKAIVARSADARAWWRRARASLDRVATVASGDVSVVLADVLGVPVEKLADAMRGDARAEELLRFVLSPPYVELRQSLGLEGGDLS